MFLPWNQFLQQKKRKRKKKLLYLAERIFPIASSSSISSPHFPIVFYSPRCCKSSIWLFERWMIIIIRIPLGKKANLLCGIVNTGSKELKKAGECCFFSASFHEFCNISCLGQESTSTRTRPLQQSCRNNNSNCLWPMNGLQQWNFPIILGSYLELDDHVRNQLFDRHLLSYHWNVNLSRAGAVKVSFLVLTRRKIFSIKGKRISGETFIRYLNDLSFPAGQIECNSIFPLASRTETCFRQQVIVIFHLKISHICFVFKIGFFQILLQSNHFIHSN